VGGPDRIDTGPIGVGWAGGVPAFLTDVPKVEPDKPKSQESSRFLKILNKEALLRIAQIS
jgi:hypothetical protein